MKFSIRKPFSNENILEEKKILREACKEYPEDFELINNLLKLKNKVLLVSKTIHKTISTIF